MSKISITRDCLERSQMPRIGLFVSEMSDIVGETSCRRNVRTPYQEWLKARSWVSCRGATLGLSNIVL